MVDGRNLVLLASNFACTLWHYKTEEDFGQRIRCSAYWAPVAERLRKGDRIMYDAVDEHGELVVLAASAYNEASYVELAVAYQVKRHDHHA